MNDDLHPNLADLMRLYARDLGQVAPSPSLDARIEQLVAACPPAERGRRRVRRSRPGWAWAAAACLALLAISAGILIGIRLERTRELVAAASAARNPGEMAVPSTQGGVLAARDLAMWPSDSVALTIPAEYSSQGTLVAVSPSAPEQRRGKRYLIDVVVSNDGSMRIERIVPAEVQTHDVPVQSP